MKNQCCLVNRIWQYNHIKINAKNRHLKITAATPKKKTSRPTGWGITAITTSLNLHVSTPTCTALVRIANGVRGAVARRHSVRVARRTKPTSIRTALIRLGRASSDSVGSLDVPRQTGTLRETVDEDCALSVGSAGGRFARVAWKCAGGLRRCSLVPWQTEAPDLACYYPTARVQPTGVALALIAIWD